MNRASMLWAAMAMLAAGIGAFATYAIVLWSGADDIAAHNLNAGSVVVTALVVCGTLMVVVPLAFAMAQRVRRGDWKRLR